MGRGALSVAVVAGFVVVSGCGRLGFDPQGSDELDDADPGDDGNVIDASPCTAPLAPSPVAHYPFDGSALDIVSESHGTEVGGINYAPGAFGEAVDLDGIDDIVQLPVVVREDFTVSFWVRTTAIGTGTATDLWFSGLGMVDAEVCGSPPDGDWGIALINGGGIAASGAGQHAVGLNDDAWHHVAHSRELLTDLHSLYVDGVELGAGSGPTPGQMYSGVPFYGVGNNPCQASNNAGFFPGLIDDLRFFDRVLSPDEIAQLSDCGH